MMQFHIVQLGRYSSAITHYIEHKQLITRHIRKEVRRWELSFVQALEWLGCGLCQTPVESGQRNKDTNLLVQVYRPDSKKCLITPSRKSLLSSSLAWRWLPVCRRELLGGGGWGLLAAVQRGQEGLPCPLRGQKDFWILSWAHFVTKGTCDFVFAY